MKTITFANDTRLVKEPNKTLLPCVIVDLDGTASIHQNRSWFDYEKMKDDTFDPRLKYLLEIMERDGVYIIFLTGRERTEECERATYDWLLSKFGPRVVKKMSGHDVCWELIMRDRGDHRKDAIVKREKYEQLIKDEYDVVCVFEDRDQCVEMWRELGLLCCQVYKGEY